jgi:hypothetical protein
MIQPANNDYRLVYLGIFILCSGLCASVAAPAERIVHFPDREAQNTLFYVDPQAEQKWWWPNPVLDASAAAARGNVTVDAHRPRGLILKADGTDDPLTVLSALAPDDLHTLIIRGKVNRGGSQVIVDTNIDACTRLSGLTCLIFDNTIVSERALAKLPAMENLEKLCVITETLDDDGVSHIARIPGLKELRLYGTIGNRSMETLSTMDTLQALFINGRYLSDVGLSHLPAMSRLRELVLSKANYTEQGLRHLAAMPALEKLDVLGFEIDVEGAAHIAAIPRLRSLALNRAITDAAAAQLARSQSLEDLNLSMHPFRSNRDLTDAGLQSLCQLSTLQSLSLYYGRFTDDGLMHLAALPCLQHLMMPNTPISESTFEHLKNTLPYLEDARFRFFVFDRDQPALTWKEYTRSRARSNRKTEVETKQQDDNEPKEQSRQQQPDASLPLRVSKEKKPIDYIIENDKSLIKTNPYRLVEKTYSLDPALKYDVSGIPLSFYQIRDLLRSQLSPLIYPEKRARDHRGIFFTDNQLTDNRFIVVAEEDKQEQIAQKLANLEPADLREIRMSVRAFAVDKDFLKEIGINASNTKGTLVTVPPDSQQMVSVLKREKLDAMDIPFDEFETLDGGQEYSMMQAAQARMDARLLKSIQVEFPNNYEARTNVSRYCLTQDISCLQKGTPEPIQYIQKAVIRDDGDHLAYKANYLFLNILKNENYQYMNDEGKTAVEIAELSINTIIVNNKTFLVIGPELSVDTHGNQCLIKDKQRLVILITPTIVPPEPVKTPDTRVLPPGGQTDVEEVVGEEHSPKDKETKVAIASDPTKPSAPGPQLSEEKTEAVTPLPPPGRGALRFDGLDDFLHVHASQTLALEGAFTVQVWVKPEFPEIASPDKARNLLCKGGFISSAHAEKEVDRQADAYGFAVTLAPYDEDKMLVDAVTGDGGLYSIGGLVLPYSQEWTHLALKFHTHLYKPAPRSDLIIGSTYLIPFGHHYKGQIGELRIWNRELTYEEIQKYKTCAVTGSEPGLAACWTFEEDTGQRIPDISGNRNDARLGISYREDDSDPIWVPVDDESVQVTDCTF